MATEKEDRLERVVGSWVVVEEGIVKGVGEGLVVRLKEYVFAEKFE